MSAGVETSERERMLAAMVDLSLERRFPGVTVPLLLERAGVDKAAFETHFQSLEDCFCQALELHRDGMTAVIVEAFAGAEGWRNQMRASGYAMLKHLGEDLDRGRFLTVEITYGGDRAQLIRDEVIQGYALLIDLGRQEMENPEALTPFTAETISSAIYKRIQQALEHNELHKFEKSVAEMMYMVVLPYLGPEAAAEELELPPTPFPPS